ncbi:MAG TPA: ROK family protein [Nocardioidaceae bacterium]|nr:ROK family protein [Nocardioidaceae bacterium]
MGYLIGVDVGGTTTKAALVDADGRIVETRRFPTPRAPRDAGTDRVAEVVGSVTSVAKELTDRAAGGVEALGVVVPGLVDDERGVAVWSENLRWRDVPLRELLAERTGVPVRVGHDVRAGAVAEVRLGAARRANDAVFLPVGTGIAAALVIDGRIHSGGGFAGEIGHVSTGRTDPCACGGLGCLETVASAAAIARRYADASGRQVAGAAGVLERLEHGDPDAARVWDDAVGLLAWGVTVLVGVLAPEVVVVGGGLAQAGERLLAPLRSGVEARLTFQRPPRIVSSEFGDLAGCLGAALLAQDDLGRA